jgi:hypothetical protein
MAGCSSAYGIPAPDPEPCTPGIAVMGDSNSLFVSFFVRNWPYWLADEYEDVTVASIAGTKTRHWRPDGDFYPAVQWPCTVLIQLGVNDLLHEIARRPQEEYLKNMRAIVKDLLRKKHVDEVLLIHTPKVHKIELIEDGVNLDLGWFQLQDRLICSENPDRLLCGPSLFDADLSDCSHPDGIHFTAECHIRIYKLIEAFLEGRS